MSDSDTTVAPEASSGTESAKKPSTLKKKKGRVKSSQRKTSDVTSAVEKAEASTSSTPEAGEASKPKRAKTAGKKVSSAKSKIEYRSAIKFLLNEGFTPGQIKKRLDIVYGETSPCYATVKNWVREFRFGREAIEDMGHDGRPPEVLTSEMIAVVEEEVMSKRRLKVREIAARLGISKTSVHRAIRDHLHMSKVRAKWVPKQAWVANVMEEDPSSST